MSAKMVGAKWKINILPESHEGMVETGRGSPIGNGLDSETKIPHKNIVNGTSIIDTSGFSDTKGFSRELVNQYLNSALLQNTENLQILFVIKGSVITGEIQKIVEDISNFAKMFENVAVIQNCFSLVITKAPGTLDAKSFFTTIEDDILPYFNNKTLTPDEALAKQVLEYLTEDSVKVFHEPAVEGEMAPLKLQDFAPKQFCTAHRTAISAPKADDAAAPLSPASSKIISSNFFAGNEALFMSRYKDQPAETLKQLQDNIKITTDIIRSFFVDQLALNNPGTTDSEQVSMHQPNIICT